MSKEKFSNGIKNYNEKMLLVARQILISNIDVTQENIEIEWSKLFSADKEKVRLKLTNSEVAD